jgi:hypothetical protein
MMFYHIRLARQNPPFSDGSRVSVKVIGLELKRRVLPMF